MSEAHRGCTSFHEYVITINLICEGYKLTWPTASGVAPPIRILLPQMFFVSEAKATTFLLRGLLPGEILLAELED